MDGIMDNKLDTFNVNQVYYQTPKHALEHDEIELYRASTRLNQECAEAIVTAINTHNTPAGHPGGAYYDFDTALAEICGKYGAERISVIVADYTNHYNYDGRLSRQNKEWAKTIEIPQKRDERELLGNLDGVHMSVLDGFVNYVREAHQKSLGLTLKHLIDNEIGAGGYVCIYNKYGDFICEGIPTDLRQNGLWALINEETSIAGKVEVIIEGKNGKAMVVHLSNFPLHDRKNEQTAQKNMEVNNMQTKLTARVTPIENGTNLKGSATVTIGDSLSVHGVKVVQGEKGLFVSMPGEMGKNGRFYDTVLPKSKAASTTLSETVLSAYQDALINGKQQKTDLNPTDLSVKVSNFRENPYENNVKGDCQITVDNLLVIKGVKVIVNKDTGELGVALPSKQDENGEYIPVANAVTADFYAKIKREVLEHYLNPPKTLGNTSYGKLADKSKGEEVTHKTYHSGFAEKVGEQLDKDNVKWSAKIEDNGKTTIAVNKNDLQKLDNAAEKAKPPQDVKGAPEAIELTTPPPERKR